MSDSSTLYSVSRLPALTAVMCEVMKSTPTTPLSASRLSLVGSLKLQVTVKELLADGGCENDQDNFF